jgi:hypothetical protein
MSQPDYQISSIVSHARAALSFILLVVVATAAACTDRPATATDPRLAPSRAQADLARPAIDNFRVMVDSVPSGY